MTLGPIEVIELAFPGNRFNGEILPELERVVADGIIGIVDGLFVRKDADGTVTFLELDEVDPNDDVGRLARLVDRLDDLISDEDVEELAAGLEPDSSAAILVFEHTWAKGFRDAVVASGGEMVANFRIPGMVVDEVLAALADETD
jgi:hypothetical protein